MYACKALQVSHTLQTSSLNGARIRAVSSSKILKSRPKKNIDPIKPNKDRNGWVCPCISFTWSLSTCVCGTSNSHNQRRARELLQRSPRSSSSCSPCDLLNLLFIKLKLTISVFGTDFLSSSAADLRDNMGQPLMAKRLGEREIMQYDVTFMVLYVNMA